MRDGISGDNAPMHDSAGALCSTCSHIVVDDDALGGVGMKLPSAVAASISGPSATGGQASARTAGSAIMKPCFARPENLLRTL